jgi:hypothetical protein
MLIRNKISGQIPYAAYRIIMDIVWCMLAPELRENYFLY